MSNNNRFFLTDTNYKNHVLIKRHSEFALLFCLMCFILDAFLLKLYWISLVAVILSILLSFIASYKTKVHAILKLDYENEKGEIKLREGRVLNVEFSQLEFQVEDYNRIIIGLKFKEKEYQIAEMTLLLRKSSVKGVF